MSRLSAAFYLNEDVVQIARALIGKLLVTNFDGERTTGVITETEAYHQNEKACHAYNGRHTTRTDILFEHGGYAYVYLCYGIHNLFNVTTGSNGEASAVLIRAFEPVEGLDIMLKRRGFRSKNTRVSSGPGMLTKALGVDLSCNRMSLVNSECLWIEEHKQITDQEISSSPRIGVDYAEEDALLPWRFFLNGSEWVSRSGVK